MDSSSLSALEHIRLRPQMYIGSTNQLGVEIVVFEAIDNAIDQYLGKHATELNVDINDKHVIVSDDGAGYPFDLRDSNNFSIGESYLTKIHNRNTADDHSPHVHCLTFGCGVFCLNALTESLVISTCRNGELWRQECARGIAISAPRVIEKGTGRGTTVDFVIDSQIFPEPLVNVSSLSARLKLCAYLFPGLKIRFQQENFCSRNGLADRVHDQMCELAQADFDA